MAPLIIVKATQMERIQDASKWLPKYVISLIDIWISVVITQTQGVSKQCWCWGVLEYEREW